jgi:hypothetical protein
MRGSAVFCAMRGSWLTSLVRGGGDWAEFRLALRRSARSGALLAGAGALFTVLIGRTCSGATSAGDAPSSVALRDIPPSFSRSVSRSEPRTGSPGRSWPGSARRNAITDRTPTHRACPSLARPVPAWPTARARRVRCRSASGADHAAAPAMPTTRCDPTCPAPRPARRPVPRPAMERCGNGPRRIRSSSPPGL